VIAIPIFVLCITGTRVNKYDYDSARLVSSGADVLVHLN
jgi:hypothetical protein